MVEIEKTKFTRPATDSFFRSKKNLLLLLLGVLFNLVNWAYLYVRIKPQAEPIFLHYNIYFGVDLIGQWHQIYFLPLTGLVILFINLWLSFIVYKQEKIVSYIIISITIFFEVIILLASLLIARQNV